MTKALTVFGLLVAAFTVYSVLIGRLIHGLMEQFKGGI